MTVMEKKKKNNQAKVTSLVNSVKIKGSNNTNSM